MRELELASVSEWIGGARPKTLPAAVVPVAVGTGVAHFLVSDLGPFQFWLRVVLALVVALGLQVGVNYANDYSDGIRGTDEMRVGPVRLVGQGLAQPTEVRNAAFSAFGIAALAGLGLVVLTQAWWLLIIGAVAILAAWFYTGGKNPYGYAGLGEIAVFIFFGPVAVVGTTFVLVGHFSLIAFLLSGAIGLLACALMLTNNLRDISSDIESGKRTLAVQLGDRRARDVYMACLAIPYLICGVVGLISLGLPTGFPVGVFLVFISLPLAYIPWSRVHNGARGSELVSVLGLTSLVHVFFGALLTIGLFVSGA